MTNDEISARIDVLERRLATLASVIVALLEAIADDDNAQNVARELGSIIDDDLQ